MAVKHSQIAELAGITVRNVGRARYETLLKDLKGSQAYKRNQSFSETIDRLERHLKTGKSKPPKKPAPEPRKGPLRSGGSSRGA